MRLFGHKKYVQTVTYIFFLLYVYIFAPVPQHSELNLKIITMIEDQFKQELKALITEAIQSAMSSASQSHNTKPKHFSKQQAAEELRCSVGMIDKLLIAGRLEKVKLGTKVLIPAESIADILENKKKG